MVPSMHNEFELGWAGGVVQEVGFTLTLDEVVGRVGSVAMMAAAFARLDDYVQRLSQMVETLKEED